MNHHEPPEGCPFFVYHDGWHFIVGEEHGFDPFNASPAERYIAACVAIAWLEDFSISHRGIPEWRAYRNALVKEMENSNEPA